MTGQVSISSKEKVDIRTLLRFVAVYCRNHHRDADAQPFTFKGMSADTLGVKKALLCPECTRLMKYALTMRLKCPHDPKPMCKKCDSPCYHGEYRQKIREIMKFSGPYLIKHGRIDLLFHYFR
jgi:hypothetical protein